MVPCWRSLPTGTRDLISSPRKSSSLTLLWTTFSTHQDELSSKYLVPAGEARGSQRRSGGITSSLRNASWQRSAPGHVVIVATWTSWGRYKHKHKHLQIKHFVIKVPLLRYSFDIGKNLTFVR